MRAIKNIFKYFPSERSEMVIVLSLLLGLFVLFFVAIGIRNFFRKK